MLQKYLSMSVFALEYYPGERGGGGGGGGGVGGGNSTCH